MIHNFDEFIDRRGTECKKWDTYGEDVIPMWIADTDFKCPQPVVDAMIKRAEHGIYGYPINTHQFHEAIANWQRKRFGWDVDAEWVEYTPAVVPAIIFALRAFTQPGDHVVLQMPAYHPFHQIIPDNGRLIAANELQLRDGRYVIDFEDLERKLSHPRARMFLLCNPHNPVGRCFTREELLTIGNLCLKHDVLVVADEIHADIVYGQKHIPFATLSAECANNCIVCVNPSKTFNIAGVRTGAAIIPNKILRERFHESVANNKAYGRTVFGTLPVEVAYNECDYYADQLMTYLQGNLDYLLQYFAERIPAIKVIKPEATYLLWLDCRALAMPPDELQRFFLEQAKVALNEGSTFGKSGTGFMRINIACRRAVLAEALRRIEAAVNKM
ncbi:MalY/PatB family protein [Sporomusa aerivorans]|uniref:MalY/PatB family protein n=1 Tax=Sporomusa aerivorans TaxID=204936 RepID=UPI00352A3A1C